MAGDLELTMKQIQQITEEAEAAIVDFIKEREQVRIHEFGTFYQTLIKSHVIKQIGTKTPRIILEQKAVKFRPSPVLKAAIYGQKPKERRSAPPKLQAEAPEEEIPIKREENGRWRAKRGNVAVNYKPTPPKPKTVISFKPLRILPRVDREKIQQKIKERRAGVYKNPSPKIPQGEIAREAEIFLRLLNQIKKTGIASVDFSLDATRDIKIFCGRPRTQVSHLPREVVKGFLTYLDIEEFHLPQIRHKLIFAQTPGYDKINIGIHSFPTHSGASIHIDIK